MALCYPTPFRAWTRRTASRGRYADRISTTQTWAEANQCRSCGDLRLVCSVLHRQERSARGSFSICRSVVRRERKFVRAGTEGLCGNSALNSFGRPANLLPYFPGSFHYGGPNSTVHLLLISPSHPRSPDRLYHKPPQAFPTPAIYQLVSGTLLRRL